MIVKEFVKHGYKPAEWSGVLQNNVVFYIRYHEGIVTIYIGQNRAYFDIGDPYDSEMETDVMQELTKYIFDWRFV